MGEVYKARDTRLDRTVAIKVMPQHIAQREDLRQRFEREARVVSSLNHPYICVLHDIGKQDGVDFMVLEHLEGETLEARLAKGPLPLDQVFKYGVQIADALDRAHRSGVSHRDVKPANIMLTRDGVKVLDFGLAKSMAKPGPSDDTVTLAMTGEGTVLGTPQYMAPELFEGKEADARSDIFGFGCVLYQMVTGKRAFDGKTRVSVVAAIIGAEPPPMTALQPVTPRALERLVQGCLVKDPEERYQSMWDVLIDLRSLEGARADELAKAPAKTMGKVAWLPWAVAVLFLFTAAAATFLWLHQPVPETRATQFILEPPPDNVFTNPNGATAISPDGRYLVFGAAPPGAPVPSLWLRPLDSLSARVLPGTDGGNFPFWSPDSRSIAFFAGGALKRIDIAGGPPVVLSDASAQLPGGDPVGGAWNRKGVILFSRATSGLQRVAASGGVPAQVTTTDTSRHEFAHGFPQFLPDGKRFIYFIQASDSGVSGVYAGSLDRPQERVQILKTDFKAVYSPPVSSRPGYLVWIRDQTVMAQRFDAGNLRLEGEAAPIAEDVGFNGTRAAFWVSDAGLLAYRTGTAGPRTRMVWTGRDGKRLEEVGPEDVSGGVRISPNGKRAAVNRRDAGNSTHDVWLFEFGRDVMTRLTFDPKQDVSPVWSPDGRQIAFSSNRSGEHQLYRKDAGGGGQEEQLTGGPNPKFVTDWSRDGKYLLYYETAPKTQDDMWALPLEAADGSSGPGARKPIPVLQTPFAERNGVFSPDGKWIAHTSNESGRFEVYVIAFQGVATGPAGKWQVSNQGGGRPKWRGDGKELFYSGLGDTSITAVAIRLSATSVESDTPRQLFTMSQMPAVPSPFDVTSDGQRLLMLQPAGGPRGVTPLTVVVNWQAGLKQ
jgi:Tol biopolymer transport system component